MCHRKFQGISYDTKKRPQIIGTNEMPDFCQMLCFSRKTRKHMQHQTNKRCSRLCGICTKTVTAVPLLSVNRGMNGSVFIWNYIKLKLNIADMEYILHFFNKYVNHFYRLRSILKSQAINAKLYLRNIISSFCTTMFAFCWQICTDCPSFRFALCLFYSFYASLASSFWNSSPEVFHPNISLG